MKPLHHDVSYIEAYLNKKYDLELKTKDENLHLIDRLEAGIELAHHVQKDRPNSIGVLVYMWNLIKLHKESRDDKK